MTKEKEEKKYEIGNSYTIWGEGSSEKNTANFVLGLCVCVRVRLLTTL